MLRAGRPSANTTLLAGVQKHFLGNFGGYAIPSRVHAALQAFSRSSRVRLAGDDVGAKRCAYPKIVVCDIDPRGKVWVGRVAIATSRNYEYATPMGGWVEAG